VLLGSESPAMSLTASMTASREGLKNFATCVLWSEKMLNLLGWAWTGFPYPCIVNFPFLTSQRLSLSLMEPNFTN